MASFDPIVIERFLRDEVARLPHQARDSSLLDLGCGAQPYRRLYSSHYDLCIAADRDVRSKISVRLDAEALPFPDASFNVVLFSEVLEHVSEPAQVLTEIARVLKPDGHLLITWPFNYMMHEIPRDFVRYTEFGMATLLARAGLQMERFVRRGNVFVVVLVLVEFLVLGMLELATRIPLVGKLFSALKSAASFLVFGSLYRVYVHLTWGKAYSRGSLAGAGLKGPLGHMSLWTLGYCATVRKRAERACE